MTRCRVSRLAELSLSALAIAVLCWSMASPAAAETDGPDPSSPNFQTEGLYVIDYTSESSVRQYINDLPNFHIMGDPNQPPRITTGTCYRQEIRRGATPSSIRFVALVYSTLTGTRLSVCASDAPILKDTARSMCQHLGLAEHKTEGAVITCIKKSA